MAVSKILKRGKVVTVFPDVSANEIKKLKKRGIEIFGKRLGTLI